MKRLFALFSLYLFVAANITSQQENKTLSDEQVPSWAMREYDSPPGLVYPGALRSIQIQKHEVQSKNEKAYSVDFHVGVTAWSWGYNMRLIVTPITGDRSKVTVGVLRSGGKVFSWGSGKKEVRKILAGIDAEIAQSKANEQNHSPAKAEEQNAASLFIESDPANADVELEGKFVGNTPITLHLKPGDYTIVVKKEGYQPWTREVSALSANELRIAAELKKEP